MTERWVFTDAEYRAIRSGKPVRLHRDDEFLADVDCEFPVIISRNGVPQDRWADGTAGVSDEYKQAAEDQDMVRRFGDEYTQEWRGVEVSELGFFVAFTLRGAGFVP